MGAAQEDGKGIPEELGLSLSREQFAQRAQKGNLVPIFREMLGDTLTPISAFMRLGGPEAEHSFLLESVEQGERLGRYTFLGVGSRAIFRGSRGKFRFIRTDTGKTQLYEGEPLAFLEKEFADLRTVPDERLPHSYGGAIGYLSYDAIRYYEEIPDDNPDPMKQEDAYLIFADDIVIFDHVMRKMMIVANMRLNEFPNTDTAYDAAGKRIAFLESALHIRTPEETEAMPVYSGEIEFDSNLNEEQYKEIVEKAREYIRAGDIFQVVLSLRKTFQPQARSFDVYRALRAINPSPYMYCVNVGPYRIVGSSPEILVRVESGRAILRPIAGTRPRGKTHAEDLALEAELLEDRKEIAEHVMLVDLARNDLGRVCRPGTVRVTEFKAIERYSHVMHIVSNCEGELREDISPYEALRRALPAGTLSGAPKIRAMQIIDHLETIRRGMYGGCLGFFDYKGEYDVAIIIRTLIFQGETCSLQAGAGIVFDSDPDSECAEVEAKMRGLLKAVALARNGLNY